MSTKVADVFAGMALDLKGYRLGLKQAEVDADATAKKIDKSVTLKTIISDLELGRKKMLILRDAAGQVGSTLMKSLNGLKGTLSGLGSAGQALFQGILQGVGIGLFQSATRALSDLVNLIPDLIQRGREYGIVVDQIGDATGATAEESSALAGTLLYLGAPVGSIVNLLGQMARNLEANEERLNAVGVATKDASGATLNQVQILENARQAFQRYGDGTAKAALISREFGRGGLQVLVDYLKLTDEQARIVTADLEAQGLIISESQRQMAETAQREGNRFQNALTGLGVTLFSVVGPQITAFFSNLSTTITEHATEIANAVSGAISFILGLVSALVGADGALSSFSGSLVAGNAVASPYSAKLLQLTIELADLKDNAKKATDGTEAQRKGIQAQIDTVSKQITALAALERQQDKTYKKGLDGLTAQLDAQEALLDAEDRAAARADRDLDLTERLRQAKIDLFEAQAQLRADSLAGKSTDQGTLDIAERQKAVVEAQRAIADEATARGREDRRAEIAAVKDYIASIATLLDEADNKKAALNTLRRREAVLEARRQAQLAAGDTEGAGDTGLKIEAIKTAELRAEEQIRNGVKETALQKQKTMLEAEKAAVKAAVVDQTAIRRAEIEKQIADLQRQQAAWDRLTDKQKADMIGITELVGGEGGLTAELNEARDAGVQMGKDWKTAFDNVATSIGTVATALGHIFDGLTGAWNKVPEPLRGVIAGAIAGGAVGGPPGAVVGAITGGSIQLGAVNADTDAQRAKVLADAAAFAKTATLAQLQAAYAGIAEDRRKLFRGAGGPPLDPIFDQLLSTLSKAISSRFDGAKIPQRAEGGWVGQRGPELSWLGERGREFVANHDLSEKMATYFARPQMPAFAGAAGGETHVHHTHVYLNGREITDVVDEEQARRFRGHR